MCIETNTWTVPQLLIITRMILWIMYAKTVLVWVEQCKNGKNYLSPSICKTHIAKILQTKGRDRTTVLNKTVCDTIWKAIKCFSVENICSYIARKLLTSKSKFIKYRNIVATIFTLHIVWNYKMMQSLKFCLKYHLHCIMIIVQKQLAM